MRWTSLGLTFALALVCCDDEGPGVDGDGDRDGDSDVDGDGDADGDGDVDADVDADGDGGGVCDGVDCSGHGACVEGVCVCGTGYTGEDCSACDDGYVPNGDECVESSVESGTTCADFPSVLLCEDFDVSADYEDILWLSDDILTHTHFETGGWDNGGYAHLRINDYSGEQGAGIAPGPLEDPVLQLNVGYMIRYGSNYGPPLDREEYKHLLVVDGEWWHGSGTSVARPMIEDAVYVDDGGAYRYRTLAPCFTAGGGCSFPPLETDPDEAWRDGWPAGDEPYRIDDHTEEWIYYEAEFVAGGDVTLYIYTRDGTFNGYYHGVPAMDGMLDLGGVDVLSYWEGASDTTEETYIDIDFLRLAEEFMGPPEGFVID